MKGCYVYMTIIIISEIITLSSDKHTLRIMKIIINKDVFYYSLINKDM